MREKIKWPVMAASLAVFYILVSFHWAELRPADLYYRFFDNETWQYNQERRTAKQAVWRKEGQEYIQNIESLNRRRCEIMLQAHEAIAPIDVKLDVIYGTEEKAAQRMSDQMLALDRKLCKEHGLSWDGKPSGDYAN